MYPGYSHNPCIVIPSHVSWDYYTDYIQKTSAVLAKKYQVLVVEDVKPLTIWQIITPRKAWEEFFQFLTFLKMKGPGQVLFRPLGLLPLQRFFPIYQFNRKIVPFQVRLLLLAKGAKKPVLWLFSPLLNKYLGKLGEAAVVHDCVDFWRSLDPVQDRRIRREEDWLLSKADVVFANSAGLADELKRKNTNIHVVPCGCDVELFRPAKFSKPAELIRIKSPIIGLVGQFEQRLNYTLLERTIKSNPDFSFVFIGPEITDSKEAKIAKVGEHLARLKRLPNAYFLGRKPKEALPQFVHFFDVGIVPYNLSVPFVQKSNPMKVYEYLAMGKPLVATPIEALKELNSEVIALANNHSDFSSAIRTFLATWNKEKANLARMIALKHSWEAKVAAMERVLVKQGII